MVPLGTPMYGCVLGHTHARLYMLAGSTQKYAEAEDAEAGWQGKFRIVKTLTAPTGIPQEYDEQTTKQM